VPYLLEIIMLPYSSDVIINVTRGQMARVQFLVEVADFLSAVHPDQQWVLGALSPCLKYLHLMPISLLHLITRSKMGEVYLNMTQG
jgi:hypothetical protein